MSDPQTTDKDQEEPDWAREADLIIRRLHVALVISGHDAKVLYGVLERALEAANDKR